MLESGGRGGEGLFWVGDLIVSVFYSSLAVFCC